MSEAVTPRSSPNLSRTSSHTSVSDLDDSYKSKKSAGRVHFDISSSEPVSKVCFVGAGYVGGPTAAVLAFANPQIEVTVVDRDEGRINKWNSKHLPIHEPGLNDVVRIARDGANTITVPRGTTEEVVRLPERAQNLFFSTECDKHLSEADIIFLSVNTPTKMAGIGAGAATNMASFESAVRSIALVAKSGAIIVEKSTVPCRTAQLIREILDTFRPGVPFEILSNPEFLAEGTAIADLLNPSRVLIGSSNTPSGTAAAATLSRVYSTWVKESSILNVHLWSSELAKLVANAMLAQRISSMNTISAICEKSGAQIADIAKAIGMDERIGSRFLNAGLGFGGSCFKKDILSLSYLAESLHLPEVAEYWKSVVDINEWQCERFVRRVIKSLNGSLGRKKITLLGYAFKKNTSDTRESQAIAVVGQLLREHPAEIAIYDPWCAPADVEAELGSMFFNSTEPRGPVRAYTDPYAACAGTAAVLIITEWDQFRYPECSAAHSVAAVAKGHMQTSLAQLTNLPADLPTCQLEDAVQGYYRPEPECTTDCQGCAASIEADSPMRSDNLKWDEIAQGMSMPRWVFDGRGVVEPKALESLGFKVESVGSVGSRSRLGGFEAN
ncbi:UDP-glucose dehydrogenase [Dothidotthia symphoricarpi CBS 119687]|uniref:UDP-glucose 6-dehydrogenase n=1 Tax=Dothidotthia symphoricarpi CBS 119687 TaxID=1392245 RepID=A0A6A6AWR9_9PLEO|nr:UDP-glucose dehydrogenase [Dothidotthia symphoricarpi CBS 119687]KAF2134971.1 UDP-glucose dehydrogenase [Dothidotthia symphoricarpi CBS 119687]